ncbi:MAG: hypothetical protein WBQ18_14500 [Solirubrobacteraceae bacterium]|jgi:hypothetical protein
MAKSDKGAKKASKDKTKGSKKKSKGAAADGISVAGHPRAAAAVRRSKGMGGVGFFAITAYLSHKANIPPDQVGLRALAGGIAGYMLAWACSVTVWRHLVLAELRAAIETGRATMHAPDEAPDAAAPPAVPVPTES